MMPMQDYADAREAQATSAQLTRSAAASRNKMPIMRGTEKFL
jgi:hypothetical protein